MVRVIGDPKLVEEIKKSLREGKLVIIAQRETARVVKPDKHSRAVFIAREDI